MLLLAGPTRPKRVARHDLYITYNDHGEWSIRVEPGGLQIDNYHSRAGRPHLHVPRDYGQTLDLSPMGQDLALATVRRHLMANRRIVLDLLIKELLAS